MEEDRARGHATVRTEGSGQHGGQGVETEQECLRVWGHAVSRVRKEGDQSRLAGWGLGAGGVGIVDGAQTRSLQEQGWGSDGGTSLIQLR